MIGAILYKDFKNFFKNKDLKQIVIILIIASIIFLGVIIFSSKVINYYQVLALISTIGIQRFTSSAFENDEKSNALDYLKATPLGAKNIVKARLILNIILLAYSLIINLMAIGIIKIMYIDIGQNIRISYVLIAYLLFLTYSQILSASIYKFGLLSGIATIVSGLFIFILLITLLFNFIKIRIYGVENIISKLNIPLTITLACLFIIFIMYKLSVRILKYQ